MGDEDVTNCSDAELDSAINDIDSALKDFAGDAAQWEADGLLEE